MDDQQFLRWAQLLEERLGVAVTVQRKAFLSSRLRTRMREIALNDFEEYYRLVTASAKGAMEWSRLLDLLTIHETRFNRHPAAFQLINTQILQPMLHDVSSDTINIRAWSVGCASGEEAYYLAMLLDVAVENYQGKAYFGVIGTDISLESLSVAKLGRYPEHRMRELDHQMVSRYFRQLDSGEFEVDEKLRQRVAFSQLNIRKLEHAPLEKMDIIFCQNVLIYFSQQRRHEIISAMVEYLKPGGLLVLGSGEVVGWHDERMERLSGKDTLAYRKVRE
ncbi:MAG: protein-glutamate O-methyltransferase CheR [Chromatiales bacterium]|nr:protein-glutamate O-methyltransferase CheR [Chromatiales bacterium]